MQVYFHHIFDSSIKEYYCVNGLYVRLRNKIIYYELFIDNNDNLQIQRSISGWETIKELLDYYSIKTYQGLAAKRVYNISEALKYLGSPVRIINSPRKRLWMKIDNLGLYKIQFEILPEIINSDS